MPPSPSNAVELYSTLLHAEQIPSGERPGSRWSYPLWGMVVASVFVMFHVTVLLVWNAPGKGLAKDFHKTFLQEVKGYEYFKGTRNTQSWAMFAPNPNRTNAFVRVLVEAQDGQLWDFEQDIWEVNRYPYLWYDRRGKVNRRIDGKKHYQRIYGAWVCREWERTKGELPKSVSFQRAWTRVPHPKEVLEYGGRWDQWNPARVTETAQETITCKTVVHGQLPNELRLRYGMDVIDEEEGFRPARIRTWWDKLEAERERAEREAARAAGKPPPKRKPKPGDARVGDLSGRGASAKISPRGPVREPEPEPDSAPESESEPESNAEPASEEQAPDQ